MVGEKHETRIRHQEFEPQKKPVCETTKTANYNKHRRKYNRFFQSTVTKCRHSISNPNQPILARLCKQQKTTKSIMAIKNRGYNTVLPAFYTSRQT